MTPEEHAAYLEDLLNAVSDRDRDPILTAIDRAVSEAIERCARIAEDAARKCQGNHMLTCKCGDGWHIAARIRAGK